MGDFLLIGLVVGIVLGFVLQRGGFCMYTGYSNAVLTKDYRLVRAALWAFLLITISFNLLHSLGVVTLNPKPFFWIGSVVGALVFVIGMVVAGGCIVGAPMKAASGKMGYWLTLLGMGAGGWLVIWGPMAAFRKTSLQAATKLTVGGANPTLNNVTGINRWVFVIILVAGAVWLLNKLKSDSSAESEKMPPMKKFFQGLWGPLAIGIGLTVGEIMALMSGKSPAGFGGFIKGWALYFKFFLTGKLPFGWPVTFVTGMLIGAFIAAIIAKEFRIVWPKLNQLPRMFFGGALMGMGAVTAAGGCNVAHQLSHMPQLSIGSFVSGILHIVAAMYLVKFLFLKKMKSTAVAQTAPAASQPEESSVPAPPSEQDSEGQGGDDSSQQ